MDINGVFPSKYLKAADLQGRDVQVVMANVRIEDIGDGDKPVLYFQGKEKGLVLNKTNANNIAILYGSETNNWIGKPVTLYSAWVDFQGRSVEAIRVRPANGQTMGQHMANVHQQNVARTAPTPPPPPPVQPSGGSIEMSEDIPFAPCVD